MIGSNSAQRKNVRAVATLLFVPALVLLTFSLAVFVVYTANLIHFPFDYDQGEGFELYDSVLFSQGQWPYRDTEIYPFYSSNYPPLFHILAVPFVWAFGPAYWYGRLLGALSTLLVASAIGYAVYRDGGKHRTLAILSGLAFIGSNTIYHIGPLFRQHITMVMLETVAIIILASAFPRQKARQNLLGLGLLIAAGYTKQLTAITALAVLVWMFIRNPRRAVLWGIGFAVVGASVFVGISWATKGEWWHQAIRANANIIKPEQSVALFVLWLKLHGFLIVPAMLFALYELYLDRLSLYSVWFVFSTVFGGISSGTWGGGDSYFATAIAGLCILSGLFAGRLWSFYADYDSRKHAQDNERPHYTQKIWGRFAKIRHLHAMIPVAIPLLYLMYGQATLHLPTTGPIFGTIAEILNIQPNIRGIFYDSASYDVAGYANIGYMVTEKDTEAGYHIVEMIRAVDGPVMSEEAGFNFVAGKEIITNPTQLLNLANAGLFDGTELIEMIGNEEFAIIILRAQFYPQVVLDAVWETYQLEKTIHMNGFDYLILTAK